MEAVWHSYISHHNEPPPNAFKLVNYSRDNAELRTLTYKEAKTLMDKYYTKSIRRQSKHRRGRSNKFHDEHHQPSKLKNRHKRGRSNKFHPNQYKTPSKKMPVKIPKLDTKHSSLSDGTDSDSFDYLNEAEQNFDEFYFEKSQINNRSTRSLSNAERSQGSIVPTGRKRHSLRNGPKRKDFQISLTPKFAPISREQYQNDLVVFNEHSQSEQYQKHRKHKTAKNKNKPKHAPKTRPRSRSKPRKHLKNINLFGHKKKERTISIESAAKKLKHQKNGQTAKGEIG